jgi:hypothetical protein
MTTVKEVVDVPCRRLNYGPMMEYLDHEDSVFICSRSSGPSDYYAEWRYYPQSQTYKLLIAPYSSITLKENNTHIVHSLTTFGDVMIYCSDNAHPHLVNGEVV